MSGISEDSLLKINRKYSKYEIINYMLKVQKELRTERSLLKEENQKLRHENEKLSKLQGKDKHDFYQTRFANETKKELKELKRKNQKLQRYNYELLGKLAIYIK